MVLAGGNVLLDGEGSGASGIPAVKIDLQGVEKKQHVPGAHQHSLPDPGGDGAHTDHELVEKRAPAAVGQEPGHRGK